MGLSPRVRGNRPSSNIMTIPNGMKRSIPACAGEPCLEEWDARSERVYPRVCGGTTDRPTSAYEMVGLSPRVRGNRTID